MPERLPPPRFSWSKLSKTAAFWLIVLLIPVVLVELTSNRGAETTDIAYFDFSRELDHDNVNSVEITQGQDPEVHGEFKAPVHIQGHDVVRFTHPAALPAHRGVRRRANAAQRADARAARAAGLPRPVRRACSRGWR